VIVLGLTTRRIARRRGNLLLREHFGAGTDVSICELPSQSGACCRASFFTLEVELPSIKEATLVAI
jgi:hypothetical protein